MLFDGVRALASLLVKFTAVKAPIVSEPCHSSMLSKQNLLLAVWVKFVTVGALIFIESPPAPFALFVLTSPESATAIRRPWAQGYFDVLNQIASIGPYVLPR